MWRKGNPSALWVGTQTGAAPVESSMGLPQKTTHGTALWPGDPTSRYLRKETQNTYPKEYIRPHVRCQFMEHIRSNRCTGAAQVPISRQADKKAVIHSHNGI